LGWWTVGVLTRQAVQLARSRRRSQKHRLWIVTAFACTAIFVVGPSLMPHDEPEIIPARTVLAP